jgi:hypothetical protein
MTEEQLHTAIEECLATRSRAGSKTVSQVYRQVRRKVNTDVMQILNAMRDLTESGRVLETKIPAPENSGRSVIRHYRMAKKQEAANA